MKTKQVKYLPCKKCGKQPAVDYHERTPGGRHWHRVECKCGAWAARGEWNNPDIQPRTRKEWSRGMKPRRKEAK